MMALTERIQSLMEDITNMTSKGNTYQLPQFMNETLWTAALEYMSEFLVDNTSLTDSLLAAQQQSISAALNTLNEIGGMSGLLKVAELYMALIDKMVVEGKDLLTAQGLGLTEYPEMYTVWELMDYLGHVMETFIYTSYMDSQKWDNVMEYNRTVNVTNIMERYDAIMSHLNDFMSDTTTFDLPQFLNTSVWEKALETITGFYASDTN